jgi:hypothetical protein
LEYVLSINSYLTYFNKSHFRKKIINMEEKLELNTSNGKKALERLGYLARDLT